MHRMLDLCGMPVKENDQQLEQLLATITKGIYLTLDVAPDFHVP